MGNEIFQNVGSLRPGRSVFDLSYEKLFTCDMGQLIPVMCDEVVPGDLFEIGNQSVIRFQPLVAPILHEINQFVHYFFVPYRILWDEWEEFITGGQDGDQTPTLPKWTPTTYTEGSLWDFLGFPPSALPAGALPMTFPMNAYNLVWNEYYRSQDLQAEVALTQEAILNRCWEKDYFTSSLPFQQRGTPPALPISGTSAAVWATGQFIQPPVTGSALNAASGASLPYIYTTGAANRTNLENAFNANTVDLSVASTFDIADLRLAFQIQKWMERNARAGVRYTEFLKAHFDVNPRDDRMMRPEYIGGSRTPIIISEVLQTSSTDVTSPQGNLAGHGISVSDSYCGKYHAKEFGLIIGIMSVMPKPAYQQGINRQWLRETKFDFYFPEFANLSEQAIINAEIYVTHNNSGVNTTLFGYQGRYDELRTKQNLICSQMRDDFDFWHLARQFSSVPSLNDTFVECVPDKRPFAVPSEPGLIVSFANNIKAYRPLPVAAEPGLIDHN